MSANKIEARCHAMSEILWDDTTVDTLMASAAQLVRDIVGDPFDGDRIRTEPMKDAILKRFIGS